jgi:hypothetical protein
MGAVEVAPGAGTDLVVTGLLDVGEADCNGVPEVVDAEPGVEGPLAQPLTAPKTSTKAAAVASAGLAVRLEFMMGPLAQKRLRRLRARLPCAIALA